MEAAASVDGVAPAELSAVEQPGETPASRREPRRDPQLGFQGAMSPEDEPRGGDFAPRGPRAHAPFIAQLIATALGFAQTRARRRGSLAEASELYGRKKERRKPSRGLA